MAIDSNIPSLKRLFYMNKLRSLPTNRSIFLSDTRVQDNYVPNFPVVQYLPNVEYDIVVFEQKLEKILDDLSRCAKDAETRKNYGDVEYYYIQILHIFYEWIGFIEQWILKFSTLPLDQRMEQCKLVDKELALMHQSILKINKLTDDLSLVLPEHTMNNILPSVSNLHSQIDSAEQLAKESFAEISQFDQENIKIDGRLANLNAQFSAIQKKLEDVNFENEYSVDEIQPLIQDVLQSCQEYEVLSSHKLKQSLKWPSFQVENLDHALNSNLNVKIKVYQMLSKVETNEKISNDYKFLTESLEKLSEMLEKFFMLHLSIKDVDELEMISSALKESLLFLDTLTFRCNECWSQCRSQLTTEAVAECDALISRSDHLKNTGKQKLRMWNLCLTHINELERLVHCSYGWLKEICETAKDHPCPQNDLQKYIAFFKGLQHDVKDHCHQVKRIQELNRKVSDVANFSSLKESVADFLFQYQEFEENIDFKVLNLSLFLKQWCQFERDMKLLEKWLSESEIRLNYIQHQSMKAEELPCVIENIRSITRLESETECKEEMYEQVRNAIEQSIALKIFNGSGVDILKSITRQWNANVQNITSIKSHLLGKVNNYQHHEVSKILTMWMQEVQISFESYSIEAVNSVSDFQRLNHEIWCWKKDLTMIENISTSCCGQVAESDDSSILLSDGNQCWLNEHLPSLNLKLMLSLEKVQFLVQKLSEFDELSSSLLHLYEIMLARLKRIGESNMKKNCYAMLNNVQEIKKYKKDIGENDEKFETMKHLAEVICEKCQSNDIKKEIQDKFKVLERHYSQMHSVISCIEETAENNLKLWNKYHEDLDLCHQYFIEIESTLALQDGSLFSLQHLGQNISKMQITFHEFENCEKLLNGVLLSSSLVKQCSDAGIQLEIESDVEMLQNKLTLLRKSFTKSVDQMDSLKKEWSSYLTNFNSICEWTERMKFLLTGLQLNRLSSVMEYKAYVEEMSKKKAELSSLDEDADRISSSSYLHPLAKKNIEISLRSLSSTLYSLETSFIYLYEMVSSISKDKQSKDKRIQTVQGSLDSTEMPSCDVIPTNKNELMTSLSTVEEILKVMSDYYAELLCIRENLILQEIADYTTISDINASLLRIQERISKLSTYYIKLMENGVKSNSFLENCVVLLQLLDKLKNLHSAQVPSDYWNLISFYLKAQIMEIYIHSHQIIMLQIINSDSLSSSFKSKYGVHNLYDCLCKFINEWDSIECAHQSKMILIKKRMYLWQQYLLQFYKLSSSVKRIKKEIAERTLFTNIPEFEHQFWITENKLHNHLQDVSTIKVATVELEKALDDSQIKESFQIQVSDLEQQIQYLLEMLSSQKSELEERDVSCQALKSDLESTRIKLLSVQSYSIQDIPASFEEMRKELEKAKVEKVTNIETVELLDKINVNNLKTERADILYIFEEQLAAQKNMCHMLNLGLDQYISAIHSNLEAFTAFDVKYTTLLKWCEKIEKKLNAEFLDSPVKAINILNSIENEINLKKKQFDDAINLGSSLLSNEEISHKVVEKVSSLQAALSRIVDLHSERLAYLKRILRCIEDLTELAEKLSNFMTTERGSLDSSPHLKEIQYAAIEMQLNTIEALQNDIDTNEKDAMYVQNLLDKLDSYADSFNNNFKQNALQFPQTVLDRWDLFKIYITRRKSSLLIMKNIWDQFLNNLTNLEEWLTCKEGIASQINYSEPGHSRETYLKGVEVFESLNHCFQDDVHLLHSVNSSFHAINLKEFNVSSELKDRVLSVNDRWHKMYKRVIEVFQTVKNILQIWEDFDQLKEHLLLFLTETDLKLTQMETTCYQQTLCENIEDDFKHHEDAKERFNDIGKHLIKQSECSMSTIQANISEIEDYWEELNIRLQKLKPSEIHPVEETDSKDTTQPLYTSAAVNSQESIEDASNYENVVKSHPSPIGKREESALCSEIFHEENKSQLYSHVVAASTTKSGPEEISSKKVATASISEDFSKHDKKVHSEKQPIPGSSKPKQKSFDDECIKDLLAALKEAEERMNILEKVLVELTPSGIDEQGPNYSRLLAACRSSVDVIQHLSQFLFSDVAAESVEHDKAEIRLQSEDVLQRWQRIENLAHSKESRALENKKSWENFSKDLKGFETWIQKALKDYSAESSYTEADMENLVTLLEKHRELISQIRAQKKIILMLNLNSQKFSSSSTDSDKIASLNDRIKTVNEYWDNLYSTALLWQSKLQSEFLQSSEFQVTLDEMRLWLEESERKIGEMSKIHERNATVLHEQHTELYALKQQLQVYSSRLETLLEITVHLFLPELAGDEDHIVSEENLIELQTKLKANLKLSRALLIKCTEMLKNIASLLGFSKFGEQASYSRNGAAALQTNTQSSRSSDCCSFFMRVARASFPIQAILLLLLGAAILLPMEEEEELSCRLSNNFASSLNPMLRYPDGPPPV